MLENPRRGRQARNSGKNVPKILDLKSSSEQIFSENCRWVPLKFLYFTEFSKSLFTNQGCSLFTFARCPSFHCFL